MTTYYSPGALTRVGLQTITGGVANTNLDILSCSVGSKESLLQRNGIRGTRAKFDTDMRKGPQRIGGTITLEPSYTNLNVLMYLAVGTVANTAEDLPAFNTVVCRGGVGNSIYTACKVSRLTISGTQGGIVSASVDVVGCTEVSGGVVDAPNSGIPYIMADMALNLAATLRDIQNFTLVIDNHIDAERFLNANTLGQVVPLDRTVSLSVTLPYNDANAALYNQAVGGAAGKLALNNGTNGMSMSFGRLQLPAESVDIPGKTELMMQLNMIATKVSGSAINTTDDITYNAATSV